MSEQGIKTYVCITERKVELVKALIKVINTDFKH